MTEAELRSSIPFTVGLYTGLAIQAMREGKPGDKITREEMARHIGRECGSADSGYGNVQTAIRNMERQHGIVWRWIKAEQAWCCLEDSEKLGDISGAMKSARRKVRRGLMTASTVKRDNLTDDQKKEYDLTVAGARMLDLCSGHAFKKRLESSGNSWRQPEIAGVIELMKSS